MQGATNLLNPADGCRSKASSQLYSQLEAVRAELEERGILPPGGLKNVTDKTWVLVKIMVPFGIPIIMRHVIFRVPKRDHNFDNHPHTPRTCRQPPRKWGNKTRRVVITYVESSQANPGGNPKGSKVPIWYKVWFL